MNYPLFQRLLFILGTTALAIATTGLSVKAETAESQLALGESPAPTSVSALDLTALEVALPGDSSSDASSSLISQSTGQGSGDEPAQVDPATGTSGSGVNSSGTNSSGTTGRDIRDTVPSNDTAPVIQDQGTPEQTPTDLNPAEPGIIRPDNSVPDTGVPNRTNPVIIDPGSTDTTPDGTPDTTTPSSTAPDVLPNSDTTPPDAGRNSPTSQAEPDRTPPGTFTPDTRNFSPGRATRSGSSYIGVGGNIGLGDGDTALGEGSFSVFSKVGLTRNVSIRPNVLVSDDPTILLPLTLDFIPLVTRVTEDVSREVGLRVSPYIGAGVAISTGDDGAVDFLATGGVDVPLSDRITATASVNATLFDNPAVGLLLGVGYNF